MASDSRVFREDCGWLGGGDQEQIEWKRFGGCSRLKPSFWAAEVEGAVRLMKKYCPSGRANEPWDWDSAAVGFEFVSALAASHWVNRSAAIKLLAAFA
jgi:hypothetical protein